eukprot:31065-Pelagococcus_subviridis.AAC.7
MEDATGVMSPTCARAEEWRGGGARRIPRTTRRGRRTGAPRPRPPDQVLTKCTFEKSRAVLGGTEKKIARRRRGHTTTARGAAVARTHRGAGSARGRPRQPDRGATASRASRPESFFASARRIDRS